MNKLSPVGVVNSFRLGADPEFCIIDNDRAKKVINHGLNSSGSVGTDGAYTLELRPYPSMTVAGLMFNIKALLERTELNQFHAFTWKAGAIAPFYSEYTPTQLQHISIGGHIHVEVPYSTQSCSTHSDFVPREITQNRLDAMDRSVLFFEELGIHPKAECGIRRTTGGYGKFGEFYKIANTSVSIPRIEYRTPCSWLLSPSIGFITVAAAKLAVVNPETAMRTLVTGSQEKMFESLVKWFRMYQRVDSDANLAITKIFRSATPNNLERLQAKPDEDFRKKWLTKPTSNFVQPSI